MSRLLVWALLCLFAVFVVAVPVSAAVELGVAKRACLQPSGFSVRVVNRGDEPVTVDKVRVGVSYFSAPSVDVDVRGIDNKFVVPARGRFDRSVIIPISDDADAAATFTSEQGVLSYPGEYKVRVEYEGCKQNRECVVFEKVACPGERVYGCEAIPLAVDECRNVGEVLTLRFHNVRRGLFQKVDVLKDLRLTLFGKKAHVENDFPEGTTVREVGGDVFELLMPLVGGNRIERVEMRSVVCGSRVFADCAVEGVDVPVNESEKVVRPLVNASNVSFVPGDAGRKSVDENVIIAVVAVFVVVLVVGLVYVIKREK